MLATALRASSSVLKNANNAVPEPVMATPVFQIAELSSRHSPTRTSSDTWRELSVVR